MAADLRQQRQRTGLSQSELAAALGVSVSSIKLWETGRKPVPRGRVSDLERLLASHIPASTRPLSGGELRELRTDAGLSQNGLAELLGIRQPTVAEWEAGDIPEGRRDLLRETLTADVPPAAALMRGMRERAGWKQSELGERVGLSQAEVSRLELGKPMASELWTGIREVLERAEPGVRPEHVQRPMDAEELREGVRRLGWTLRDLANALGVSRGAVGPWASGAKRIPPERWAQIRAVLGTAAPVAEAAPRDRVAEALPLVLDVIEGEPGIGRQEAVHSVDAPEPHARGAVVRALEQGLVHERRVPRTRGDGVMRLMTGLFPGPRPADVPPPEQRVEVAEFVVPEVIAAVEQRAQPRGDLVASLPHDRRLAERAIARALRDGVVHEEAEVSESGRIRMVIAGGERPTAAPAIGGDSLRRLREQLGVDQEQLARRLGVPPALVRRWERRSGVGPAWRKAIGQTLRPVRAEATKREGALRRRLVDAVREQPGLPRWGELVRLVPGDRLGRLLDELIDERELHERPTDNGHGAGLFVGPPPPEWEPGEPIGAGELRGMREWAGLTQKELASRIGAGVNSVNAWELGDKPVPAYRRAQLRQVLAKRKPPDPPPISSDEFAAERQRVGWSQVETARRLGVTQPTAGAWERGDRQVPPDQRDQVRRVFAQAPTAPRVSRRELRRFKTAASLSSRALAELLEITPAMAEKWLSRGVPRDQGAAVRALLDGVEPAQRSLFEV